jgi:hypothetical protein
MECKAGKSEAWTAQHKHYLNLVVVRHVSSTVEMLFEVQTYTQKKWWLKKTPGLLCIEVEDSLKATQAQILRVGQNHIYPAYIRYFWQRNHQIYGHIRCMFTVLASPTNTYTFAHCNAHATCSVQHQLWIETLRYKMHKVVLAVYVIFFR